MRKLMEEERAFLNPDEWGIDLRPAFREFIDPPPDPGDLSDGEVRQFLCAMIDLLGQYHFCLEQTDHLTDRELYRYILGEIIPEPIGVGPNPIGGMLHHECCSCESEEYLQYFASDENRAEMAEFYEDGLPPKKPLVADRDSWISTLAEAYRDRPLPMGDTPDVP